VARRRVSEVDEAAGATLKSVAPVES
jgi:hypothetical protein